MSKTPVISDRTPLDFLTYFSLLTDIALPSTKSLDKMQFLQYKNRVFRYLNPKIIIIEPLDSEILLVGGGGCKGNAVFDEQIKYHERMLLICETYNIDFFLIKKEIPLDERIKYARLFMEAEVVHYAGYGDCVTWKVGGDVYFYHEIGQRIMTYKNGKAVLYQPNVKSVEDARTFVA
jgi:hypothetical protein